MWTSVDLKKKEGLSLSKKHCHYDQTYNAKLLICVIKLGSWSRSLI